MNCPECDGAKKVDCPNCEGFGVRGHEGEESGYAGIDCNRCEGEGKVPCEECVPMCERCSVRFSDPCFSTPGNPRCGRCEL